MSDESNEIDLPIISFFEDFDTEVTGILEDVYFLDGDTCAYARVFRDKKNRFHNGTHIRTSRVLEVVNDRWIFTLNSIYEVGSWKRRPKKLQDEIDFANDSVMGIV